MTTQNEWEARRAETLRARGLKTFETWAAFRAMCADRNLVLYYWAPMDRHPVRVHLRAVFKNGKVRVSPGIHGASAFTIDAGHLDRLSWRYEVTQ